MEVVNPYYIRYTTIPLYEDFYKNVMSNNILCVLPPELTSQWSSRLEWFCPATQTINFEFLEKNFGEMVCPVYRCNEQYFNSNPASTITLSEYIAYWKKVIGCGHRFKENGLDILYLKDWHLFSDREHRESPFVLPELFESDYLNDYCVAKRITDYKFVYLGPKGTSTPLHIDVFGSFSWSANICGFKRWLFIPEKNVPKLKTLLPELPQNLYNVDNSADILRQVEAFEIYQAPGETVFVPSGYMHQVENLEDTISINHNWFNACNLRRIFHGLIQADRDVQAEIQDLKADQSPEEWFECCDRILTVHFGMNFEKFFDILQHRLSTLDESPEYFFKTTHEIEEIRAVLCDAKQVEGCQSERLKCVVDDLIETLNKF